MFAQQLVNALSLGSVYALFALGFTLIFGVLGVINLAHGAVFMLGAYAGLLLVSLADWPLYAAVLGGMAVSGVAGALMDLLVLRPLRARNAPHLAPLIATIGVAIFLTNLVQGLFGAEAQRFPYDAIPTLGWDVGSAYVSALDAIAVGVSLLLAALLVWWLKSSRSGQAVRAIAENPKAALLLGVNVEQLFLLVAAAAGGLGGAAGVLFGVSYNAITPFMGQAILDKGFAIIILGGMGDVRGALLGGLFLGFAEVMSVAYLSSSYRDAVAFGLLFLVLLIRPSGLFGQVLERKA